MEWPDSRTLVFSRQRELLSRTDPEGERVGVGRLLGYNAVNRLARGGQGHLECLVSAARRHRQYAAFFGVQMPRKSKGLKSKLREAAKACHQGKTEEANNIWRQVAADRLKLKADKAAARAAKKTKSK